MTSNHDTDPQLARRITLDSYQAGAELYVERTARDSTPRWVTFRDAFVDNVRSGRVLELGSGPGWDAIALESMGVIVDRSDATPAFVDMMTTAGHDAKLLDVTVDEFGGPYDGIFANAVLLHLTSDSFENVLAKALQAVRTGGTVAFTLKEGDGAAWSTAKLDLPRFFTYWREAAVREVLAQAGWSEVSINVDNNGPQPWLLVLATRPTVPS